MAISPHPSAPDAQTGLETLTQGRDRRNKGRGSTWYKRARYLIPLVAVAVIVAALVAMNLRGIDTGSATDDTGSGTTSTNPYDEAIGTFEPVTLSGTGGATVSLPTAARNFIVTIDYTGSDRFFVDIVFKSGAWPIKGYMPERGPYSGTSLFGAAFGFLTNEQRAEKPWRVRGWSSSGKASWEVTVAPISSARELPSVVSGTGDEVFLYSGGEAELQVPYVSALHFEQWGPEGRLVPHGYTLAAGPSVVTLHAAGPWSATVK